MHQLSRTSIGSGLIQYASTYGTHRNERHVSAICLVACHAKALQPTLLYLKGFMPCDHVTLGSLAHAHCYTWKSADPALQRSF
jgi:hypothetical protein